MTGFKATLSLQERWTLRREQALDAAREFTETGTLSAEDAFEMASLMHKLAGTAGMFGEDELGTRASIFERALKVSKDTSLLLGLAQDLLAVAEEDVS